MARRAVRFCILASILGSAVLSIPTEDFETVRTSNAAILNRLGLIPQEPADGHHRKRLAGPEGFGARLHQSPYGRRHSSASPHDSHVYVVKLPPSLTYYSYSKPLKQDSDPNVTVANPNPGFRNNGKPAKIYHWNLPLVKKMNEKKKHLALLKVEQARKKIEAERERQKVAEKMNYIKKLAQEQLVKENPETKPSRNNDKWLSQPEKAEPRSKNTDDPTMLKILSSTSTSSGSTKIYRLEDNHDQQQMSRNAPGHHHLNSWHGTSRNDLHGSRNALDSTRPKKHRKKSAVSYYYAPTIMAKSASTSISKHFSGNGKPKAFYVMEKSRKPIYYHQLLP